MVLDLSFGRRIYDFLGSHERLYRAIRWVASFGCEKDLQRRAIAKLGLRKGDLVLDLACGTGVNLSDLVRAVGPSGRVIALDYSEGMLNVARSTARARGWENIEFIQADAASFSLPAGILDAALCTFALSAIPGEREALLRVAKALKPGANFVSLDAKALTGFARVLNPVVGPIFKYTTNWDYKKDVIQGIAEVFEEMHIEEYHFGSNYIACARSPRRLN